MTPRPDNDRLLDQALGAPLLDVPDDFADRVMAALPALPAPAAPARPWRHRLVRGLQLLALATGSAAGLAQALVFAAGLWSATAVGVG